MPCTFAAAYWRSQPRIAEDPAFIGITESLVWKNVVLGKLDPHEAVSNGDILVGGADPQALYVFPRFLRSTMRI
jgi:hypothetical protein